MEESPAEIVVEQDHVVPAISHVVWISHAGLQAPNRPMASFLFLGPTKVRRVWVRCVSLGVRLLYLHDADVDAIDRALQSSRGVLIHYLNIRI